MRWASRSTLLLATVLLGLFGGQWLVSYLEGLWWTETVATNAVGVYSRRTALGITLEGLAITVGFAWWAWHVRSVVRTTLDTPTDVAAGSPVIRQVLQSPSSRPWALLLCIILAVLLGSGLADWADAILLAWEGVRFGIYDPALGRDLGFYVARLPLLVRLHALATILVVGTIAIVLAGHLLTGNIRVGRGTMGITQPARRQMGLLAACLAVLLALHQMLLPLQLAAGIPHPVAPDVVELYRSVSFILVGVALAVVVLSLLWSWRPLHSLAAGGWSVFTLALVLSYWLLPSGEGWPESERDRLRLERYESLAFGFAADSASALTDATVSLWDGPPIDAFETSGLPGSTGNAGTAWVRVVPLSDGAITVRLVRGDTADSFGRPVQFWSKEFPASAAYPGASGVVLSEGGFGGMSLGSLPRRLALAWALQSWRFLSPANASLHAMWGQDTRDRLTRLMPLANWRHPQLLVIEDIPTWVLNGVLVSEAFPMVTPRSWNGLKLSYARTGLVGLVRVADGATTIFLAPDADSLAHSVARLSSGLVQSASALPPDVRERLAYDPQLFALHAKLWSEREARRLGLDTTGVVPLPAAPAWGGGRGPSSRRAVVLDHSVDRVMRVLEGQRNSTGNRVTAFHPDSVGLEPPSVLLGRWQRLPEVQALRDSVNATGGTNVPGVVRYAGWNGGLIAYQPFLAKTLTGEPRLVGIGIAWRNRLAVGRTLVEAWRRVSADGLEVRPGAGESDEWFQARRWLRVADSALARGDLVTFGRAFAALRQVLERR